MIARAAPQPGQFGDVGIVVGFAASLAMAFKLMQTAQDRWRAVNAPHLVALVRAGATFTEGKLVERPDDRTLAGRQGAA